jgi:soluble cytochrome b562
VSVLSGVSSSGLYQTANEPNSFQQLKSEFQQLGQDLQDGNLTQAQQDFSVLTQNATGGLQSNSSLAQAFSALGQALQAGNLSAAQQAYSTIQQDVQQGAGQAHHGRHHHHGGGSESSSAGSGEQSDSIAQAFGVLGQALQSGNLTAAQQAYSTLQQDFQQFGGSNLNSTASQSTNSTLNATA